MWELDTRRCFNLGLWRAEYRAGNQMCHVITTDALIIFNFIIKATHSGLKSEKSAI